jgi:hypothetical protein
MTMVVSRIERTRTAAAPTMTTTTRAKLLLIFMTIAVLPSSTSAFVCGSTFSRPVRLSTQQGPQHQLQAESTSTIQDTPTLLPDFTSQEDYLSYMESVAALPQGFATGTADGKFVSVEAPSMGPLPIRGTIIHVTSGPTDSWAAVYTKNKVPTFLYECICMKTCIDATNIQFLQASCSYLFLSFLLE